jgi:hypothetical protein
VKYPPGLDVRDRPLDRRSQATHPGIVFHLAHEQISALGFLDGCDVSGALIPLIGYDVPGKLEEEIESRLLQSDRVMAITGATTLSGRSHSPGR